eukprot:4059876-Lingulodinium_polyedra.AAC.1
MKWPSTTQLYLQHVDAKALELFTNMSTIKAFWLATQFLRNLEMEKNSVADKLPNVATETDTLQ